MASTIKCPNCGLYNKDSDYCTACNTVLSYKIRREIELARQDSKHQEQKIKNVQLRTSFIDKYSNHRLLVVRLVMSVVQGVWFIVMAIGGFFAWLITFVAG